MNMDGRFSDPDGHLTRRRDDDKSVGRNHVKSMKSTAHLADCRKQEIGHIVCSIARLYTKPNVFAGGFIISSRWWFRGIWGPNDDQTRLKILGIGRLDGPDDGLSNGP